MSRVLRLFLSGSIAVTAASAFAAAPSKAKTSGVTVSVATSGLSDTGFVHVLGEVHNGTADTIHSVRVGITYLDAKGQRLKVDSILTATAAGLGDKDSDDWSTTTRNFIPPGETGVFEFLRDAKKITGTFASAKTATPTYKVSSAAKAPKITIDGFTSTKNAEGDFDAKGSIKNDGKVGCRSPRSVFAIYDAKGVLVKTDYEEPDELFQKELAPGKSVAFTHKVHDLEGKVASVKASGDCSLPE